MIAAFVVDASVSMTWLFQDEVKPQTTELLDRLATENALVPALWFLEVANVLMIAERKGRITSAQTDEFILQLSKLGIQVAADSADETFEHLLPLCRTHQLTSYDAAYLDLAIRHGLPLATLDEPLRKAAEKLGVKLLAS